MLKVFYYCFWFTGLSSRCTFSFQFCCNGSSSGTILLCGNEARPLYILGGAFYFFSQQELSILHFCVLTLDGNWLDCTWDLTGLVFHTSEKGFGSFFESGLYTSIDIRSLRSQSFNDRFWPYYQLILDKWTKFLQFSSNLKLLPLCSAHIFLIFSWSMWTFLQFYSFWTPRILRSMMNCRSFTLF